MSIHQLRLAYIKNDGRVKNIRLLETSQEFNRKDLKEIENYIVNNLAGDIKHWFAFLRLESGRFSIISMNPVDKEEYILHVVTLDNGHFSFYPIEAYGSSLFRHQIQKNAEIKSKNISNLKHLPLNESLSFESMADFVKKTSGYNIKKLVSILIGATRNKERITLNGSEKTITYTAAALQMAFPVKLAHNMFFLISSEDGKVFNLHITTCKEYNNSQDTIGMDSSVNIEESFNNLETNDYRFSHIVELGYLIAKQNLEAFHVFLSYFCYENLDEKIEDAYNLFLIIKTGIGEMELGTIKSAVEFAYKYGTNEAYRQILVQMPGILDKISREINIQSGEVLTIFLFKAANQINSIFFLDRVYDFFYKSIYNMIFSSDSDDIIRVSGFYDRILELNSDKTEDFARYALNLKRIDALNNYLIIDREAEKSKFYLRLIVTSLIKLKYQWKKAYSMNGVKDLIDICIENVTLSNRNHKSILIASSEEEDYFVNIFIKIYEKLEYSEKIIENLWNIFKSKDDIWTLRVRKYFKTYDYGDDILFKEFLTGLDNAENLIEYFDDYYIKVFCEIQDYREKYISKALKVYFERIADPYMFTASFKLISGVIKDNLNLEKDVLSMIIKGLESEVSLSPPSDEIRSIIPAIKNLKKTKGIVTTPDITQLLDFGIWIDGLENSPDIVMDEIIKEGIDLADIDMKRYGEYLNWCLPITISCCDSPEDHRVIIRIFNITDNEGDFFLAYMSIVEKLLDKENFNGYEVLLSFITYFFFYFEPKYKLQGNEELLGRVKDRIIEILSKQNKSWLQRFSSEIKDEFSNKGLSIPVQWDEIYNSIIEDKNKSLFKKIKEAFNKNKR